MLSKVTGVAELELDADEAKSLAGAAGEVMSHYNISFLDDKTTAWINLIQVGFGIYGTRVAAYNIRRAAERKEARDAAREEAARITPSPTAPAFTRTTVENGLPNGIN